MADITKKQNKTKQPPPKKKTKNKQPNQIIYL